MKVIGFPLVDECSPHAVTGCSGARPAVLTADNPDDGPGRENAGELLCAKVAKEVHDYFVAKQKR